MLNLPTKIRNYRALFCAPAENKCEWIVEFCGEGEGETE